MRKSIILLSALTGVLCSSALAQEQALSEKIGLRDAKRLCFKGGPRPNCKSFLLSEFGATIQLDNIRTFPGDFAQATWELGWMRNINAKYALGAAFYGVYGQDGLKPGFGFKPRIRFWLNRWLALDVAPGILVGSHGSSALQFPEFTGHLGLSLADWLAVTLQYERHRFQYNDPFFPKYTRVEGGWYVGIRVGSYAGAVLGPVAAALLHFLQFKS